MWRILTEYLIQKMSHNSRLCQGISLRTGNEGDWVPKSIVGWSNMWVKWDEKKVVGPDFGGCKSK